MDRIIKFRCWNTGERFRQGMFSWEEMVDSLMSEINPKKSLFAPFINSEQFKEKPWIILMQFTGLLDKNGKEIYTGDIVKNNRYNNVLAKVVWTNGKGNESEDCEMKNFISNLGSFIFEGIGANKNWMKAHHVGEFEIIGNIYENPELLHQEEVRE